MSTEDIVNLFDELGITDTIIKEAGELLDCYSKEELASCLTLYSHKDILKRLLGVNHSLTRQFNTLINERIIE